MPVYAWIFLNILLSVSCTQASQLQCGKTKIDYDHGPIYLQNAKMVYKVSLRDVTCEHERLKITYETLNIPHHTFQQNYWTAMNYTTISSQSGFDADLFSDTLYQGIELTDTKGQLTFTKSPVRLTFVRSNDSTLSTVWIDLPDDTQFTSLKFITSFIAVR